MTGKRYKSVGANLECPNGMEYMLVKRDDGFNVCQVCSKYTAKEIVDELNNLADENEQLKSEYKVLHTQYQDLRKFVENNFDEHLTQEKLNRQIIKLSDENKELKRELQTYRKVVGCFNCHYHNYDWYDDGDEFEVCDKGNDVTEGICKEWEG